MFLANGNAYYNAQNVSVNLQMQNRIILNPLVTNDFRQDVNEIRIYSVLHFDAVGGTWNNTLINSLGV